MKIALNHIILIEKSVIPAQAGISLSSCACGERDSRLRGNDINKE
jgi:hypothetical protein